MKRLALLCALFLAGCGGMPTPDTLSVRWLEPAEGATVSGEVSLLVAVTPPGAALTGVTFAAGDTVLGAGQPAGGGRYGITWDVGAASGDLAILVRVADAAGGQAEVVRRLHAATGAGGEPLPDPPAPPDDPVPNPLPTDPPPDVPPVPAPPPVPSDPTPPVPDPPEPDGTPPVLSWLEPAQGMTVTAATALTVRAEDTGVGVAGVRFYLGDAELGEGLPTGANRYSLLWDTRPYPDGTAELRVVAYDGAGNRAEASVTAMVANTPPALAARVLELVNAARAEARTCGGTAYGPAPPMELEPRLSRAAQKHSEDMQAARKMSHTTPEGAVHYPVGYSPWQRMAAEGYRYRTAAENVAWGYRSPEAVMDGWLGSSGHCANLMNPALTQLGVGEAGTYWTQKFGAPR